jgi:hypothetical protein
MTSTRDLPLPSATATRRRTIRTTTAATTLAAMLLAFATACGGGSVTHGTVVEKDHEPAHTEYKRVKKSKKTGGYRTRTVRHSECWQLELRNKKGDTGDICVSRSDYDRVKVGDKW